MVSATGLRRIDDSEAAALLARYALLEIRALAQDEGTRPRIHFLADLAHNLPGIAHSRDRRREGMSWLWESAGAEGRAWILETIEFAGCRWTPPPAPPPITPCPPILSGWQRMNILIGRWPVRTPFGRKPLPASSRVLKALTTDEICALHEEAELLRLGLGKGGPGLRQKLDADAIHYLVPDPAPYYWPDGKLIRWWQCHGLLCMRDGTRVKSSVAVLPERFEALPDNVPRREQLRLVRLIRAMRYDLYLWGRDHQDAS